MSVPDYNDPLRHTNLPSPRPSTSSISRVRGDSRHMIDVCLWRNQEGAQINFSLSSFDFVWLTYFLTPSQDAAWRNGQWEKSLFAAANFYDAGRFLPAISPTSKSASPPLLSLSWRQWFILTVGHGPNKLFLMSNLNAVEKLTCFSCICHFDGHGHNSH